MRRPRSSGAPRWVATAWWLSLFGAACLLAVAGCRDHGLVPTGPLPPRSPVLDQSLDSPSSAEAEFIVADEAPLAGAERDLGRFPTPTVVRMAVHQSFTVTPVDPTERAGAMGLAGRVSGFGCSHQGEAYLVNFPAEGGYGFPFAGCQLAGSEVPVTSFSDIVMVSGLVRFGYSFDAACPYPNQSCARYAGSSGVALERLRATIAIGGDSVRGGELRARAGREYVLRAEATPDRMGRFATPILPVGSAWHFAPDSGPARPDVCDNGSGRTCTMTFDRSGSLTLTALVNGEETVSAPLRVQLPALSMAVSADAVSVGDTVQVTTTVSGLDSTALSYYAVTTYGPKGEQLDFAYDRVAGTEAPLSVTHPDPAAPGVGGAAGAEVKARDPAARSVAPTSAAGAMAAAGSMARASGSLVPEPASRSVGDAGSGGLPPCLRTRPVPTRCYVVLGVAGRARIEAGAFLDRFGAMVGASRDVAVRGGEATVRLSIAKSEIRPSARYWRFNPRTRSYTPHPTRMPDSSRTLLTASVVDASGRVVPDASIRLEVAAREATAGHEHRGGKPAGLLEAQARALPPDATISTGSAGVAKVYFVASEVSGPVTIKVSTPGAPPESVTVHVKVPGLTALEPGMHYEFTGAVKGRHTSNHFGTRLALDAFREFADSVHRWTGEPLGINDISLEDGGLFDVGEHSWDIPHGYHRLGTHADLRSRYRDGGIFSKELQLKMKDVWQRILHLGTLVPEADHLHLNFYP